MGNKIQVTISGVKHPEGKGRVTMAVNLFEDLDGFLAEWGQGDSGEEQDQDWNALKASLAGQSPEEVQKTLAKMASSVAKTGAKSEVSRVVDAVCAYLEKEHGFAITDTDPGDDRFYISKANLSPTKVEVPNDGYIWTISAAAPFGLRS